MQTMTLSEFIADSARRATLAQATSSSPDYLWQVATGWKDKRASPRLAERIESATDGLVRCDELRPDVQWTRNADGRVIGYQVVLGTPRHPRRAGKQVIGNVASVHGTAPSRKRQTIKTPRVKGASNG